ncbi:MAG: LysE family transporter [Intrasporangiaceae bacterium]|mgnify:CR=1 FL=1|nr:LysE family transporter [Intrasporangiaceae bacterium]
MDPLLLGLALGLGAGISPGPLFVLVVTSALRGGWRAGVLAAFAPVVSDLVVIAGVLLVLDLLPSRALPMLAVAGGLFLLWTAFVTVRDARAATLAISEEEQRRAGRQALWQAGLLNLLSPHPWLFWATVLGPLAVSTWRDSSAGAILLVVAFYVGIVGAKALLAVVVSGGRRWLTDVSYRRLLVAAGLMLGVVGVLILVEFLPAALS